ncbi:MAG: enoyl-CoA hydratase [Gammaproteobacteria bacterium]|nr:MAG: enoyl-CoA hydratase [Gammaproteobacteria bacterium]
MKRIGTTTPTPHPAPQQAEAVRSYRQLCVHHDPRHAVAWCYMHASPRPCFTPELLEELHHLRYRLVREIRAGKPVRFVVLASDVPGVFNLGGDLALFLELARNQDREGLLRYGRACIDILWENHIHLGEDLTTISLVQGDALGGGFETALASNVLIAERGSKLGFPEILFNLFPGMGAYSLLLRRAGPVVAERLITSGKLYEASELYEMGVIDILADAGEGERAVYDYIRQADKAPGGMSAIRRVVDRCSRLEYQELLDVVELWVDTALQLRERDMRLMERFVRRQTQRSATETGDADNTVEQAG